MPAIVTCDSCNAKLRTPNAPALGRKVTCPKCGEAITVSADNCATDAPKPAFEVVDEEPAPAKPKRATDEPAKPKARARVEVEEDDEDEEDDAPKKKPKAKRKAAPASGKRLPLLIGGGVLLLVLVGVGVALAVRGGGGTENAGGPGGGGNQGAGTGDKGGGGPGTVGGNESKLVREPKRALPTEIARYWPGGKYTIEYSDYTRPTSGAARLPFLSDTEKDLGLRPEQLQFTVGYSEPYPGKKVRMCALKEPFDLPAAVRTKATELAMKNGTAFQLKGFDYRYVAAVKPTLLVFVDEGDHGSKFPLVLDELAGRPDGLGKMPADLWALFQEVSGYRYIRGSPPESNDEYSSITPKARVEASNPDVSPRQTLICRQFAGAAKFTGADYATRAEELMKQQDGRSKAKQTVEYQVVGSRLYRLVTFDK